MPIHVDETIVISANALLRAYIKILGLKRTINMLIKRPPADLEALGLEAFVSAKLEEFMEVKRLETKVKNGIDYLLGISAEKYTFMRFATSVTTLRLASLAFLASPPDITLKTATESGPIVKTSSYIDVHFIPVKLANGKIHRPVITKFFYSIAYTSLYTRIVSAAKGNKRVKIPEPLVKIYKRSLERYVARGYPRTRASKLAFRDALRVYIGCVWLVRMHELLDNETVKPDEIILPYKERLKDILLGDAVEPYMIGDAPRDYTWRALIEKMGIEIGV